jgi:hypothetical protein
MQPHAVWYIQEDSTPHNHCCDDLKSYLILGQLELVQFWLILVQHNLQEAKTKLH